MIVYNELTSLCEDLGFSAKALYTASSHINNHYHTVKIPKKNGDYRELSVPDPFLKSIQKKISEVLLPLEEVSPYATAYKVGCSNVKNAKQHIGKPIILKLDIRKFFDKVYYPLVKDKAFPSARYSEKNRILLSILCTCKDAIPQGAPTSPQISNIILKDFDNTVGEFCKKIGVTYTRYCDDMTFSGDFSPSDIIRFVKTQLKPYGLYLNSKKTVVAKDGQKQCVTGVVVNEKANISSEYRKKIRQEMYYCQKFGIESHIKCKKLNVTPIEFARSILGRINYILSVDKNNDEMSKYKKWIVEQIHYIVQKNNEVCL